MEEVFGRLDRSEWSTNAAMPLQPASSDGQSICTCVRVKCINSAISCSEWVILVSAPDRERALFCVRSS